MQHQVQDWFPAKRYGCGWGMPVTWQGWVIMIAYVLLIAIGAATIPRHSLAEFITYFIVLTVLFAAVCWWKGEPPRWRWGGD